MSDEKEIKNVTRHDREELHRLLDNLLDEGVGTGTFQTAYAWPSKTILYRTYRIQIKQYDVEK